MPVSTSRYALALGVLCFTRPASPLAAQFTPLGVTTDNEFVVQHVATNGSAVLIGGNTLWTPGTGNQPLPAVPGLSDYELTATGVSGDGASVFGFIVHNATRAGQAFVWSESGGYTLSNTWLPDPAASSNFSAMVWPNASSYDGAVLAGVLIDSEGAPSRRSAFRWEVGQDVEPIDALTEGGWDEARSNAYGISADGTAVVGSSRDATPGTTHIAPTAWTQATGTSNLAGNAPELLSELYEATAASSDGSIVVGRSDIAPGGRSFIWTESGGFVEFGPESTSDILNRTTAIGVSDDGTVIGRYNQEDRSDSGNPTFTNDSFLWDKTNGMRTLEEELISRGLGDEIAGWDFSLASLHQISADGTMLSGTGINPDGEAEAWIAVIPEPGSAVLLSLGAVAMIRRRR